MKVKIIFKEQTYYLLWCPNNFEVLYSLLPRCFKKLPKNWSLECKDTLDGNAFIIGDQEDLDVFIKTHETFKNVEKTLYIVPTIAIQGYSRLKDKASQYSSSLKNRIIKEDVSEVNQAQSQSKEKVEQVREDMIEEVQQNRAIKEDTFAKIAVVQEGDPMDKVFQRSNIPKHYFTICDGCYGGTIVGVRYKCTVCPDFNFCEECEQQKDHPHNFLKMKQCDEFDLFKYELTRKKPSVKPAEWMRFDSNTDSLVQELFNVRKRDIRQVEEYKDNFVAGNDLKSNKIAENNEEIPPEFLVQDEDLGEIDKILAGLLDAYPEEDVADLYEFASKAPKGSKLGELKMNYRHDHLWKNL